MKRLFFITILAWITLIIQTLFPIINSIPVNAVIFILTIAAFNFLTLYIISKFPKPRTKNLRYFIWPLTVFSLYFWLYIPSTALINFLQGEGSMKQCFDVIHNSITMTIIMYLTGVFINLLCSSVFTVILHQKNKRLIKNSR